MYDLRIRNNNILMQWGFSIPNAPKPLDLYEFYYLYPFINLRHNLLSYA